MDDRTGGGRHQSRSPNGGKRVSVAATVLLALSWPIFLVIALLRLATWRDRRREAMIVRQIRLTDAIASELGQIVAPVVARPLGGPWRVRIRVPVGRTATVGRIVAIAHDTLEADGSGPYELILTPARAAPPGAVPEVGRGIRVDQNCRKYRLDATGPSRGTQ
jgi:hypothetical protein